MHGKSRFTVIQDVKTQFLSSESTSVLRWSSECVYNFDLNVKNTYTIYNLKAQGQWNQNGKSMLHVCIHYLIILLSYILLRYEATSPR
jgi:hypothetical protein